LKVAEKIITPLAALEKMQKWCAYQERSQFDVRKKLHEFRLEEDTVESIVADLISENYLNEERFAMAYAGGKFRMKNWGRKKIKIGLKQHKVSDVCIRKALAAIDEERYAEILAKVIEKKIRQEKKPNDPKTYYKILNYAISRGFESDLAADRLKEILQK
jgi:regulatory protein